MKKIIAVTVFALVMLGAAGAGTVAKTMDGEPQPIPTCPTGPRC